MIGVIVNVLAIAIGGIIGVLFKKFLSEKITKAVMVALGLATFVIGLQGALKVEKPILFTISIALGTLVGTIIDIDKYVHRFGEFIKKTFVSKNENEGNAKFVEAFASASILFGVGAMAVVGSINAGLNYDYSILFLKAVMDGTASMIFASSMGIGVAFSSITIFILEGGIALLAGTLKFLAENAGMMNEFAAVGNLLVMVIGLNLLDITKIKVANMLPAIIFAVVLYM